MRTTFFFFLMFASMAISATVTVTPMNTDYTEQKVTFKVEWTNSPTAPYNNRVWIWIDFCPIIGITPGGFAPATITGATITSGSGSISGLTGRGFFITGSTTNSGTTITTTLNPVPAGQFNWCAYGSDYPPNATVNAGGGYTLRGTAPFTINGSQTHNATDFDAGTCITSITDPTGRPDGFASPALTVSNPNSPSRCNAGAVTLSATVSGGTTTAMTYTWDIGGTNYTTTANSYTIASLASSTTYTVKVKNANNCESNTASGNITVNYPGTAGQSSSPCGCATGTIVCGNVCATACNSCDGCLLLVNSTYPYAIWVDGLCVIQKSLCINGTNYDQYIYDWSGGKWVLQRHDTGTHTGCNPYTKCN